ncbi:iron complex transport system ATP-binding protein [Arcanobacterium wilhelmae]|uniref:Iron complex transport system ATP-binding protein n=1 Tax=Arcanobacterium wilhelmae TaxID=1803177 RepID=A0ABT9NDK3_9ACTO|nr:ATP-binding cassette domain-containing protein [Arcanobacterium wilhelmae]MDP9801451.1 iron complex transport system ATP-binding protein [Arcanobacterium wilhelmae]WFN90784.1 ATP-binding cassette domain-containing protein [Arcanobacterium wilhelmae]
MIVLDSVTRSYSKSVTIGPVSEVIPSGGITVLVGPNGAGKSTLLTMIGRLQTPNSGTITVGGRDVATTPSSQLARVLAILRQENHFVTRLTVRQLVSFGRFPYSGGRLTADDEAQITAAIRFLGLEDLQGRFLDQLSGGQRQRAYVAMVLAQDTEYVLLDEPLNNLDMQHSVAMMRQLRRAGDELGRTVVMVVHDINFAARYADHIIAMRDGSVVAAGAPDEICTDATLSEIFGTPVRVGRDADGKILCSYFS